MEVRQFNPWLQIWVKPRETLRKILEDNPKRVILWLALISGLLGGFAWAGKMWITSPEQQEMKNYGVAALLLFLGAIGGLIYLYVGGWLYQLAGAWLGGRGNYTDVKCAIGWAQYPAIVTSIISLFDFVILTHPWIQALFGLLLLGSALWAFILFLYLLAEAHRFSVWKALFSVLIAFLLLFVAILLITLIIPLLVPLFK